MLWECGDCGTLYAIGLPYCPQCTSTNYREPGMPKTTVEGGASNAAEAETPDAEPVEAVDETAPSAADIRAWAKSEGIYVPPRGALSADVTDAYREAHAP